MTNGNEVGGRAVVLDDRQLATVVEVLRDAAEALSVQAIRALGDTERANLADVATRCMAAATGLARANNRA